MELANDPQTILAYEMNGQTLPMLHGAPLRLRVETQLGFTMVKYIRAIEFVENDVDGRTPYADLATATGGRRRPCGAGSSSSASPARCTSTWNSTCPVRLPVRGLAVDVGAALTPGGGGHGPGEVPRDRLRCRHHGPGEPGGVRRLPRRGIAV